MMGLIYKNLAVGHFTGLTLPIFMAVAAVAGFVIPGAGLMPVLIFGIGGGVGGLYFFSYGTKGHLKWTQLEAMMPLAYWQVELARYLASLVVLLGIYLVGLVFLGARYLRGFLVAGCQCVTCTCDICTCTLMGDIINLGASGGAFFFAVMMVLFPVIQCFKEKVIETAALFGYAISLGAFIGISILLGLMEVDRFYDRYVFAIAGGLLILSYFLCLFIHKRRKGGR